MTGFKNSTRVLKRSLAPGSEATFDSAAAVVITISCYCMKFTVNSDYLDKLSPFLAVNTRRIGEIELH